MNEPQPMPPGRAAPYTRGEVIMMWLCWVTPGIATGLFLTAYLQWFWSLFRPPEPVWYSIILWGLIATVLLGCAGFAAVIHAGKSGQERFARRVVKLALLFILAQIFVAPMMGWFVVYLIFGR
ncbi:hypothetical protein OKA05_05430 [Luteolibacter arcticus]|uniref:Uncharacterized protein n=1 Tax=Luteolibacter arcticus TaxID=1581411 RepID=A0ABT3GEE0_9BACT|nr:hypothetical protein [Luteolibacter arcticus]MCW1921983.1 hypothetical protein [Luteolibacter arcticus]